MLKHVVTATALLAASTAITTAHAAPATLVDGSNLGWAEHCQKAVTVEERGNRDYYTTGCPITMKQMVEEWDYAHMVSLVPVADRLAARELPSWVSAWQEGSLSALKSHFQANGFDSVATERIVSGSADRVAKGLIADNEKLPKLQRKELGLIVVAGEPGIEVEYEGEIKNPNPRYTGSNPFKQLGAAVSATGNGPFVFDGAANLTAYQAFFVYDPSGELLDKRVIEADATADGIHLSIDDPKFNDIDITSKYTQMKEIKRQGYASTPSKFIEDNRYERFKAAFADLGDKLAAKVAGSFEDTQRIKEAAGL